MSLRALDRLGWPLLVVAVGDWLLLRSRPGAHPPILLAVIVALAMLLLSKRALGLVLDAYRGRRRRGAALAEALCIAGLLTALAAGMTNWLLSLQGSVIVYEGETVPLHGGTALQAFEGGPLSDPQELGVLLALEGVDLEPVGPNSFIPRSHLQIARDGNDAERVTIDPSQGATFGSLRFLQGAFGFAPRIVIIGKQGPVFDETVPFLSERRGATGVSFEGYFTIARERLRVQGRVDLQSLDEGMRGHAELELAVEQENVPIGSGRLRLGHFAEIDRGYRIGFADLSHWSEIMIARRNYTRALLLGAAVALLGAMLWMGLGLGRWIGRTR